MVNELIDIINKVKEKITDQSNMVWTHYDNAQQLIMELDGYLGELKNGNLESLKKLDYLFGATASLQEHSVSNGWQDEYMNLASEFDQLYERYKNQI